MKKLIIAAAFILFAGVAIGQSLQKGGSFGLHVLTVNLDPDVTMNQYLDFFTNKFIPELEKHFEGLEITLMKGDRGVYENKIGWVNYYKSEKDRDRYWPEEGKPSDEGKAAKAKVQPIFDELRKLGTWSDEFSGWVIQ